MGLKLAEFEGALFFLLNLRDALLEYIRTGEEVDRIATDIKAAFPGAEYKEPRRKLKRFRAALDALTERMTDEH